jgi:hypothetical protein
MCSGASGGWAVIRDKIIISSRGADESPTHYLPIRGGAIQAGKPLNRPAGAQLLVASRKPRTCVLDYAQSSLWDSMARGLFGGWPALTWVPWAGRPEGRFARVLQHTRADPARETSTVRSEDTGKPRRCRVVPMAPKSRSADWETQLGLHFCSRRANPGLASWATLKRPCGTPQSVPLGTRRMVCHCS